MIAKPTDPFTTTNTSSFHAKINKKPTFTATTTKVSNRKKRLSGNSIS